MVTERGFLMEVEVGGLSNLSEVVVCGEVEWLVEGLVDVQLPARS